MANNKANYIFGDFNKAIPLGNIFINSMNLNPNAIKTLSSVRRPLEYNSITDLAYSNQNVRDCAWGIVPNKFSIHK